MIIKLKMLKDGAKNPEFVILEILLFLLARNKKTSVLFENIIHFEKFFKN
jgi:hypothetical protein